MTTLPTWLDQHIRTTTGAAPGARYTTRHRCRHCKTWTLTGLDEDVCAFHATVDPTPLTTLGEALALLAGRNTYELRRHNTGHALWRRDRWQIKGRTAGTQYLVVAEHRCNTDPLPTVTLPTKPIQIRKESPDAIPF